MATSTPELRKYSHFRGWNWTRMDALRVRLWNTCKCNECRIGGEEDQDLILNSIVVYEMNDACMNLSGVKNEESPPLQVACIPHTDSTVFCQRHYTMWLNGAVLPSQEIVLRPEHRSASS
jgi:hypothetical protein